eukprot:gb/GFBE01055148.1/.p1 GENE.gb/GFBE01055148.1/~~gb/GFBE01055148.1/.p1  ORF type:complete len:168 (+),score=68.84 gb/GFBE01055148.1/:1-504(+)
MDEFKDSKTALVADVDCTAGGQSLCETHQVKGYPTIKHGDPNDLQDYNGGRDFASLQSFAQENLGPTCGPDNVDLCSDEDKALIEKFQKMDPDELDLAIEEADNKVKKIEEKSKKAVDGLNKKIQDMQKNIEKEQKKKDDAVKKESKKIGLRVMRAVAAAKKKKEEL